MSGIDDITSRIRKQSIVKLQFSFLRTMRLRNLFRLFERSWIVFLVMLIGSTATLLARQAAEKSKNSESESGKAVVAQLEEEWLTALNNADVDAIAKILADDFLRPAPDPGRFVNKVDLLSFYRSHLSPQSPDKRRIENITVTLYGRTALARGELTTRDSEGHVSRRLLFTDVFVQRNGKWQAVSAQEDPVTTPQTYNH